MVPAGNGLVGERQSSGRHSDELGEALKVRLIQALIYNCPNDAMPKNAWPEAQKQKLFPASFTQSRHFKKEYAQRDLLSLIHTKHCMCYSMTLGLEIPWKSQWNFHYSCSGGSIALRPEE